MNSLLNVAYGFFVASFSTLVGICMGWISPLYIGGMVCLAILTLIISVWTIFMEHIIGDGK